MLGTAEVNPTTTKNASSEHLPCVVWHAAQTIPDYPSPEEMNEGRKAARNLQLALDAQQEKSLASGTSDVG